MYVDKPIYNPQLEYSEGEEEEEEQEHNLEHPQLETSRPHKSIQVGICLRRQVQGRTNHSKRLTLVKE